MTQPNFLAGPSGSDEVSMTAILLKPLANLQTLSETLFQSLSPVQSKRPPPPPISAFLQVDADLASAVQLAHVHQGKQRQIERLKEEVLGLEERWREICEELEKGKRELEICIEEGEERIKGIELAKEGTRSRLSFNSYGAKIQFRPSIHTLPRSFGIRPEFKCIYVSSSQYARPLASRPTTTSVILSSISE